MEAVLIMRLSTYLPVSSLSFSKLCSLKLLSCTCQSSATHWWHMREPSHLVALPLPLRNRPRMYAFDIFVWRTRPTIYIGASRPPTYTHIFCRPADLPVYRLLNINCIK